MDEIRNIGKRTFGLLLVLAMVTTSFGQLAQQAEMTPEEGLVYVREEMKFIPAPTYSAKDGIEYNDPQFYSHPDFGKLTHRSPYGKRVVEDIGKRKLDERYYVDLDDPTFFYIEKSATPVNFYQDGLLCAIDVSLHEDESGNYKSGAQPCPTELNLSDQHSGMQLGEEAIKFNNFRLKMIQADGSYEMYDADWSDTKVGSFGAYISEVFPSIDMVMTYREGRIKSNFVIKEKLEAVELIFIDQLELSENLALMVDEENELARYHLQVYNTETAETYGVFKPAIAYNGLDDGLIWHCKFDIDGTNLNLQCDAEFLDQPEAAYPLIVDPTFVAAGPITSAFPTNGSLLLPSFCASTLLVGFPGGTMPWDVQTGWTVYTQECVFDFVFGPPSVACDRDETGVYISTTCGGLSPAGAPPVLWTCFPGCGTPGFWTPTIPFASSGSQSLAQCWTPMCSAQTLSFTHNLTRTQFCNSFGGVWDVCDWVNSLCSVVDTWNVTVQGRSVETLGNTATGSGSLTINDADCIGTTTLDPTPLYGVSPYTYAWLPGGATGATLVVPTTPGVYTCDVTDFCLNTVTATFTIGCPLSIDLTEIEAVAVQDQVLVKWETTSEMNHSHFTVQRMNDDGTFSDIGTVQAKGGASSITDYSFYDSYPRAGINYYRLAIVNDQNEIEYTEIVSATMSSVGSILTLVPNPSNGSFKTILAIDNVEGTQLVIRDINGRLVYEQNVSSDIETISAEDLAAGVYQVEIYKAGALLQLEKLVIQK